MDRAKRYPQCAGQPAPHVHCCRRPNRARTARTCLPALCAVDDPWPRECHLLPPAGMYSRFAEDCPLNPKDRTGVPESRPLLCDAPCSRSTGAAQPGGQCPRSEIPRSVDPDRSRPARWAIRSRARPVLAQTARLVPSWALLDSRHDGVQHIHRYQYGIHGTIRIPWRAGRQFHPLGGIGPTSDCTSKTFVACVLVRG